MTEKPSWEPTPEEWRVLAITFIGGLASIVVGAVIIGAALALGRWVRPGPGLAGGSALAVGTLLLCFVMIWLLRSGRARHNTFTWSCWGVASLCALILVLMWIGVAAGVH